MNRSFLALACVGGFLLAPLALAGPGGGAGRHGQRHGQRHGMARGLRALELTDAQKAQWREARAAAEPVREDLRTQIVALRQARKAAEDTAEAR